jgi:hypothetical protein
MGLDRLLDCHCELLSYVRSERPCVRRVVRFSLARCILIRVSATLSNMSDDSPPCSNVVIQLSKWLHLSYDDNVVYFV